MWGGLKNKQERGFAHLAGFLGDTQTSQQYCRVGQGVKTRPFHGRVTGSIPVRGTKLIIEHSSLQPVELIHKLENYQSHPSIKAPLSN